MAQENLTLWTEVDVSDYLTVTADAVVAALVTPTNNPFLYKDKGVDGYNGDFTILAKLEYTDYGTYPALLNVSKDASGTRPLDMAEADAGTDDAIGFLIDTNSNLWLNTVNAGTRAISGMGSLVTGTYYVTFTRVGVNMTLYFYTDAERTILYDSVGVEHIPNSKRFVNAVSDYGVGSATWGLTLSEIDIGDEPTPTGQTVYPKGITINQGNSLAFTKGAINNA